MSTTQGKNNFRNPEVRKAAKYKLWLLYNTRGQNHYNRKKAVFYSYNKKKGAGLEALLKLATTRAPFCDLAILYNNQSGKELQKIHQSKHKREGKPPQQKPKRSGPPRPKRKRIHYKTNRFY